MIDYQQPACQYTSCPYFVLLDFLFGKSYVGYCRIFALLYVFIFVLVHYVATFGYQYPVPVPVVQPLKQSGSLSVSQTYIRRTVHQLRQVTKSETINYSTKFMIVSVNFSTYKSRV